MKVGIIGVGLQGERRARALQEFDDTELVMVADIDKERANLVAHEMQCQATTSWEEVVAEDGIDAIVVCTPPNSHASICIAAAKKGKHVLCEKPLAMNPEEAEAIIAVAQENRVKVKCGFILRHHPGIRQAHNWLDEGIIGEPVFLRCRYGIGGRPDYDKEWRANPEISGGGELMDQGIHALDLARYFLGDFSQVFGFVATGFWDIAPLEDNAFVLLRTVREQVASIHVSWTQWRNLFSLEIFGKEGYIQIDGLGGSYGIERAVLGKRDFLKPFMEEVIEFRGEDKSWGEEWKEFTAAINADREPLGNGRDGLAALRLVCAVYESASNRHVVKLSK